MEIALSGLIILLILLPGISYRRGYFSGEFSNQYTNRDFFQLFVNTLFPSLIIYFIFLPLINIAGFTYDFRVLLGILSSEEFLVQSSISKIDQYKDDIIWFQLTINSVSFFSGLGLRNLIVGNLYDTRTKFFRYKNIWHYLLSGKFMLFKRSQIELIENKVEDVDYTFIDALVAVGEEAFIYTGILVDYELSSDGGLNLIYLREAQRKVVGEPLSKQATEENNEQGYRNIPGHVMVLKYDHIINLNISFIQIEVTEGSDEVKFILIR